MLSPIPSFFMHKIFQQETRELGLQSALHVLEQLNFLRTNQTCTQQSKGSLGYTYCIATLSTCYSDLDRILLLCRIKSKFHQILDITKESGVQAQHYDCSKYPACDNSFECSFAQNSCISL